jgi:hypothetical protein
MSDKRRTDREWLEYTARIVRMSLTGRNAAWPQFLAVLEEFIADNPRPDEVEPLPLPCMHTNGVTVMTESERPAHWCRQCGAFRLPYEDWQMPAGRR